MPSIKTSSSPSTELYYEVCGQSGPTVVLVHGWPLSHRMWEQQVLALTEAGYQVVTYDRRGFGDSGRPWTGYDYDTMSADLQDLLEELDVTDATLVGFSMGGGEVARYLGQFGSERVAKAVFVSAVTPYLLKTDDNPDGVDQSVFDDMMQGVRDDRIAFLDDFGQQFVGWGTLSHPISEELLGYLHTVASFASPRATRRCITAFAETDFRDDLKTVDVPTLFVHGDADEIVPLEVSAQRAVDMVSDAHLEVIDGAPHGLNLTHTERFHEVLMDFLRA